VFSSFDSLIELLDGLAHLPAHKETFESRFLTWVIEPLSLDLSNVAKHFPTAKSLIDAAQIYPEKMNALMMALVNSPLTLNQYIGRFEDLKLLAKSFPGHKNQLAERALQRLSTEKGFSDCGYTASHFLSFSELFPEYSSDIMFLALTNMENFSKIFPLDSLITEQAFNARLQTAFPLYAEIFGKLKELYLACQNKREEAVQNSIITKIEGLLMGAGDKQHEARRWIIVVRNFCLTHPSYNPKNGSQEGQNHIGFFRDLNSAQRRLSLYETALLTYNPLQFSNQCTAKPVRPLVAGIQADVNEINKMRKYLKI